MAKVYYENGNVKVTESAIHDGGDVYQLRNINATKLRQEEIPWVKKAVITLCVSLFFLVPTLSGILESMMGQVGGAIGFLLACGIGGFLAFRIYKQPRFQYYVALSTSSGEVSAFTSYDRNGPEELSAAITSAMGDFGKAA